MKYFGSVTTRGFSHSSAPFLNELTEGAPQLFSFLQGWAVLCLLLTLLFMIGIEASNWLGSLLFSPPLVTETSEAVVPQK